jgi:hypothetical protein
MAKRPEWVIDAEEKIELEECEKQREIQRRQEEAKRLKQEEIAQRRESERQVYAIMRPFIEVVNSAKADLKVAGYIVSSSTKLNQGNFQYLTTGNSRYQDALVKREILDESNDSHRSYFIYPYGVFIEVTPDTSVFLYLYESNQDKGIAIVKDDSKWREGVTVVSGFDNLTGFSDALHEIITGWIKDGDLVKASISNMPVYWLINILRRTLDEDK